MMDDLNNNNEASSDQEKWERWLKILNIDKYIGKETKKVDENMPEGWGKENQETKNPKGGEGVSH